LKRDQDTEMKLADDYRAQSKEFGQSLSAHKQLTATLGSATTSPAATLAAATKFMKILDPGSVVRESELGMALAASGVIDRAMNYISTLQSGQKLTPTQAADFKKVSDQMFGAAKQVQQQIDTDYKLKANTYGLRPEMVVQDLGQNAKEISFGDLK
jgi:D-serine deaminase-like pyridoxal phosphate-dependent protein